MSYLDFPRLQLAGLFKALPSTVNNIVQNYTGSRWSGDPSTPNEPTDLIQLLWAPNGTGVFDLVDCQVKSVAASPSIEDDPMIGAPVSAVYTKAPPKIVDLDPMQQGVSEIWGLVMQIGDPAGAHVTGTFQPAAFDAIWKKAKASSVGGSVPLSAVYQSTLTELRWNVAGSQLLRKLNEVSPNRLSIRLVVDSHNNNPQIYLINEKTLGWLAQHGLPPKVLEKLTPLTTYNGNSDRIPTSSYLNLQLRLLLGEELAEQHGKTILEVTALPYSPPTPTDFGHGRLIGAIGPAGEHEPAYAVPARRLAPPPPQPHDEPPISNDCFFAAATLDAEARRLSLDLGNSLPVEQPGEQPSPSQLGTLSVAYRDTSSGRFVPIAENIQYSGAGGVLETRAGMVDLENLTPQVVTEIQSSPLALFGTPDGEPTLLLLEDAAGISLRADQFVFRMNPGVVTTSAQPRGETVELKIYVRRFGSLEGTEAYQVRLSLLTVAQASVIAYDTGSVPPGSPAPSIPRDALEFTPLAPVENGVASFELKAKNPGNPRGTLDGQVYFLAYELVPEVTGLSAQSDLVSIHVYEDTAIEHPSWGHGIEAILTQYGQLYPIMTNMGLSDHQMVRQNAGMIAQVLALPMEAALHMPVTRDLSESRRKIILGWLSDGAP